MKVGFSVAEQAQIFRAKSILKQLWKNSGFSQKEVLEHLRAQGLSIPQSTLSTWFSTKEGNYFRPKTDSLELLIQLFCPPEQREETLEELRLLLGYLKGPMTPEMIKNKVAHQLRENTFSVLEENQHAQRRLLQELDVLLEQIEPLMLNYSKGYPTLFVPSGDRKRLRQLIGKERRVHTQYAVEGGYEIPFSHLLCSDTLTEIINRLNEGTRLLQAYIDRHISAQDDGQLQLDFFRVEEYVMYAWEIADKLLQNNTLCKATPVLKRTLLRTMTVAWGIQYILENQNRSLSEIQFQNILRLKGKHSDADIYCSVAVYKGALARQYLRSPSVHKAEQGLKLFQQASQQLETYYPKLSTEQDSYFYKKELANLYYDMAHSILNRSHDLAHYASQGEPLMKKAYLHYHAMMNTPNVFVQGLCEERAVHIHIFYMISACWSLPLPKKALQIINLLRDERILDAQYWKIQIAKAIAYSVLAFKAKRPVHQQEFLGLAREALHKSCLPDGFRTATEREINSEFVLKHFFADQPLPG
ncbi:MAG: hypothetical protein ACO1RX_17220 [Candidatus Sericytochromatia bacterium]